jgi:hypothetical protein
MGNMGFHVKMKLRAGILFSYCGFNVVALRIISLGSSSEIGDSRQRRNADSGVHEASGPALT